MSILRSGSDQEAQIEVSLLFPIVYRGLTPLRLFPLTEEAGLPDSLGIMNTLIWLLLFWLQANTGAVQVRDDFESGSLGAVKVENDTTVVITPRLEKDESGVNSAITWFYGRLSNVLQRDVTIRVQALDYTVYNGQKGNVFPFERNTVPVFSYDNEHWERFTDCAFDKPSRTLRIRHIFSRDPVWIAYIPPYTFSRLEALVSEIRAHPAVTVGSLGKSAEGRPLYVVDISEGATSPDRRPVAWFIARQHAFEAGGSWALEGMLRFLTSAEPEAQVIRRNLRFRICPMINPDGVTAGRTRFNARGADLNRHWHPDDPLSRDAAIAPEITLLKQEIERWRAKDRLDLWINIHNNDMVWNEDGDYIRFAPASREPEARRLELLLRKETIFTGPFDPSTDPKNTESVVASATGALSLLMEMKTGYLANLGRWTGTDLFLAHGRNLARVAYLLLQ
jgi:hypothetical protein